MALVSYKGREYYVNKLPKEVLPYKIRTDYMMAKNNINIFFRKNITNSDFLPHIRSVFQNIRVLTEKNIKENGIYTLHPDYEIKYIDDTSPCFISTLYNTDKKVILIKHSFNYSDILISPEEIEYLFVNTMSKNESLIRNRNILSKTIEYLIKVRKTGFYTNKDMKHIKADNSFYERMFTNIIEKDTENYADVVFSRNYNDKDAFSLYTDFFTYREKRG